MKYLPRGTINSYLSIPQVKPLNIGHLPLPPLVDRVKKFWDSVGEVEKLADTETDAITFYCLNHLVAVIRQNFDANEKLPPWAQNVMERYVQSLALQSKRLYAYILLIISRESRHIKDASVVVKKFSPEQYAYVKAVKNMSPLPCAKYFVAHPPSMPLGTYVQGCCDIFYKGTFSGGYGGAPWGHIAKCLYKMVVGQTSAEIMVDTAYTLAHNGGPMFNKGMFYQNFDPGHLLRILDIQRGGQMPEAVLNTDVNEDHIAPFLTEAVNQVKAAFPSSIGEYVDWKKIKAAGAIGNYSSEIADMPKEPPKPVAPPKKGDWVYTGDFYVMPGKSVQKFKRVA